MSACYLPPCLTLLVTRSRFPHRYQYWIHAWNTSHGGNVLRLVTDSFDDVVRFRRVARNSWSSIRGRALPTIFLLTDIHRWTSVWTARSVLVRVAPACNCMYSRNVLLAFLPRHISDSCTHRAHVDLLHCVSRLRYIVRIACGLFSRYLPPATLSQRSGATRHFGVQWVGVGVSTGTCSTEGGFMELNSFGKWMTVYDFFITCLFT